MRNKQNKVILTNSNILTYLLSSVSVLIQCAVTPMYARPRALQQSVVVATNCSGRIALTTFAFIVCTRSCSRRFRVRRHMTVRFGCIPTTSCLNAGSSTKPNGSRPSVTKFSTSVSTFAWDTLVDFAHSNFGCFVGFSSDAAGSFRLPDTSSM